MPHGPFRHRDKSNRQQDTPDELSRLFGLDTSTDPGPDQPTAIVDSPIAVTVPATSTITATSQTQPCTYLCLLRVLYLTPLKPPPPHRLLP